ncbi:MAG: LysM peptidoglycan-binding domain-containing protein [Algiphilus sp.]
MAACATAPPGGGGTPPDTLEAQQHTANAGERTSTAAAPKAPVTTAAPRPVETREGQRVRKTARYVVKQGDTLWDIAERFLIDPWKWPEVWVANRQVANPHLIYPGDVLELRWLEGQESVSEVAKLEPQIRREPLEATIPTIPLDLIQDFLDGPLVVGPDTFASAPYLVEFADEHLMGPDRTDAYARGLPTTARADWLVVHEGEAYVDPESGRILGYEAIPAADTTLSRHAEEVAVLRLSESRRETRIGDALIPRPRDMLSANFFPRAPDQAISGRIISVFGGVTQIGQYDLVILNRGATHGLEIGHVLDVFNAAREVPDPRDRVGSIRLPEQYAGELLVVRVADDLAQALVMEAERTILLHDEVRAPDRGL